MLTATKNFRNAFAKGEYSFAFYTTTTHRSTTRTTPTSITANISSSYNITAMSFPGAWTSANSVTAVDSDLGSFLNLTFDVNYDGPRRIPSIVASAMADGHTVSENMAPRTADWVQQQSAQDQPPARAMVAHHPPAPVTPPPRGDPVSQQRRNQVYDISALLEMRNTQRTAQSTLSIMQRVKSEALGGT